MQGCQLFRLCRPRKSQSAVCEAHLTSSVKLSEPGMTLKAFGQTSIVPVVHIRLSSRETACWGGLGCEEPPHRHSSQLKISDIAGIGSFLIDIGTVPA